MKFAWGCTSTYIVRLWPEREGGNRWQVTVLHELDAANLLHATWVGQPYHIIIDALLKCDELENPALHAEFGICAVCVRRVAKSNKIFGRVGEGRGDFGVVMGARDCVSVSLLAPPPPNRVFFPPLSCFLSIGETVYLSFSYTKSAHGLETIKTTDRLSSKKNLLGGVYRYPRGGTPF